MKKARKVVFVTKFMSTTTNDFLTEQLVANSCDSTTTPVAQNLDKLSLSWRSAAVM
tara:strand:+ start:528 stop:695 length:168 start_codon:yes stop_codon:yes gene_type:complete